MPADPDWTQQGGGDMEGVGPDLEKAAHGVTRTDLDLLKKTAPSVISEVLLKNVLDINQVSFVLSHAKCSDINQVSFVLSFAKCLTSTR